MNADVRTKQADRTLKPNSSADGLAARDLAVSALFSVLKEKRAFDDAFAKAAETRNVAARDRAFARLIAITALRRRGEINAVIGRFLEKPLPDGRGRLHEILLAAAAQLLVLQTPPHAAISLAVDQCQADREARRFDKLMNAVLRRISERGADILKTLDGANLNFPPWLLQRWRKTYGDGVARLIAEASLREAPLDLTVKSDPVHWAEAIGGVVLPSNSVRVVAAGKVDELPGYEDGAWWVQDAAAALPARLFGDVRGRRIADLCAAPGGKTAQLANAGALVTAVDKSPGRLSRLSGNLARLGLACATSVADAAQYKPQETFEGVLIDAPCTATGTIRRHPDILYLKRPEDVAALAQIQTRILDNAATLVQTGGMLVYCTCSLEPEEGRDQIDAFLQRHPHFQRSPVTASEIDADAECVTPRGDLQTLPHFLGARPEGQRGMDGFFASRLLRRS